MLACDENKHPDMVEIPAGEFILGFDSTSKLIPFMSDKTAGLSAQPRQTVFLETFYIDRFETTYEDFINFKPTAEYSISNYNEPVRGVNWFEADAYCLAIGKRLPTELEWEKTARGSDNRLFVWGNEFIKENANFSKKVVPVDIKNKDKSEYGVWGMNGNVSEWTSSWYQPYPNSKHTDENYGKKFKITRGGSFFKRDHGFIKEFAMIPYRNIAPIYARFWDTGFRCALSG
ncbi:MAG: SUMF1/EgtB/PvdO family nonheme iron enzyme [Nitrospinota bacterium]|nr:SUMF1/EgtB/PvdO family nonheme iron enzyme [Nitrospinota bacterium]